MWLISLVGAGVLSSQLLGDALTTKITFTNDPESVQALDILEEIPNPGRGSIIVWEWAPDGSQWHARVGSSSGASRRWIGPYTSAG